MSLEQFLENLTLEELEELKRLKLKSENSFYYSTATFEDLESIFDIRRTKKN